MLTLTTLLFVLTAGFTASALAANLYRISGFTPETTAGHIIRLLVLTVAGPSEIFETAVDARINGRWSAVGCGLVMAAIGYWCLILGIIVVSAMMRLIT